MPAATPVTTPDALTVAMEVFELLHVPPAAPLLLYCAVPLIQIGEAPLTVPADTFGLTVNNFDALTGEPQPLLTV